MAKISFKLNVLDFDTGKPAPSWAERPAMRCYNKAADLMNGRFISEYNSMYDAIYPGMNLVDHEEYTERYEEMFVSLMQFLALTGMGAVPGQYKVAVPMTNLQIREAEGVGTIMVQIRDL